MKKESSGGVWELISELFVGEENARSAECLERELFIPHTKTAPKVRELAREANLAGYPVMSGPSGFWLATSFEEIRAYEQSLISRAMAILARARALATVSPWSSSPAACHARRETPIARGLSAAEQVV